MLSTDRQVDTFKEWSELKARFPDAAPLLEALSRHDDPFSIQPEPAGFEVLPMRPVEDRPNRARMKVFPIPEGAGQGRMAVFFYKPSQIPHSKVRYSYGVCLIPVGGAAPEEAGEWLFFVSSGLHPYARPSRLRLAFSFTIPE